MNTLKKLSVKLNHPFGFEHKVYAKEMSDFHSNYTLNKKKVLGRGASAIVFEATDNMTLEKVAVKCVKARYLNKSGYHYIRREIEALRRTSHRNIVKLYDVYEGPKSLYIVMEKIEGKELFDSIIEREKYNESDGVDVIKQLASALLLCHEHGIIHRDLKPENIIIENGTNTLKLIDFGYCSIVKDADAQQQLATNLGSEGYWAPEVMLSSGYTSKCDVWSLGVIMYVLLCGCHPFLNSERSTAKNREAIRKGEYYFHPELWTNVSDQAKELIVRMLQVNSHLRISLKEVLNDPWINDATASNKDLNVQKQLSLWTLTNDDDSDAASEYSFDEFE